MEILDKINKEFNNKYDFLRVLKVEYNTLLSCAEIWFLYPENIKDLEDDEKKQIIDFIKNELSLNCEIKIKFKKSYLDENLIKKHLINYLKNVNSSLFAYYQDKNIEIVKDAFNIVVKFNLIKEIYDYFIYNNLKENILNELNKNFIANFSVEIFENKNEIIDDNILIKHEEELIKNLPQPKKVVRYEVYEPEKIIGVDITPMPEYIKGQPDEKESVILAGEISNLAEKTYISRRTKKKGGSEESYYYTFTLTDKTASIPAIYFSNKTTYKKVNLLKDGDKILVIGNIRKGQREKTLSLKSISFCEIINKNENIEEKEEGKPVQNIHFDNYRVVKPTVYMPLKQENIFDKMPSYNDFITNNNFVVFDVETTGLEPTVNEIIEIGAVKIVNGKIKEQFQTLICPENEIPEEITNLTTITNDMVKNAPSNNDAISDFYKFCENCSLVGYNVSFDFAFINNSAKKAGLYFNNQTYDAMVMAKNKLYLPRYRLINVVEALNLTLNNAHRALADATATAEVFLKLNEI